MTSSPELVPFLPANLDTEKGSLSTPEKRPGGWRSMPYILGFVAADQTASYGLMANTSVYLMERYGMGQVSAVKVGAAFGGTVNFMPLVGAFVADSFLGRYRTLVIGSVISFLGMITWTLASLVPQLQPEHCIEMAQAGHCPGPTKAQLCFLYFSMGLLAVGAGGVRPCTLPFGVDQFDCTTEQGKRDIKSYFNWYYCLVCAAAMISMTLFVYIQDNFSWSVGFSIPTCLMLVSLIFFFIGSRLYVNVPPEGSPFSRVAHILVASFKKRNLKLPYLEGVEQQGSLLYDPPLSDVNATKLSQSERFRFLNKAAIICDGEINPDGTLASKWRLCSIQQAEEIKCLMQIMLIWLTGIFCFLALSQQFSFVVLQALNMDRRLGPNFQIPAASMGCIGLIALVLFMPIYQLILVPLLRNITKEDSGITVLQRQGIGMVIAILAMLLAAEVEKVRRASALSHGGVSPMSVLWLVPQLTIMGIAEAFNAVGQIEFYNRQFPESMQTLAGSLLCLSQAGASYMTNLLVFIIQKSTGGDGKKSWLDDDINEGRLDYYYYIVAAIGVVSLICFLPCANSYHYKGV